VSERITPSSSSASASSTSRVIVGSPAAPRLGADQDVRSASAGSARPLRQDRDGGGGRPGHVARKLDVDWQRAFARAARAIWAGAVSALVSTALVAGDQSAEHSRSAEHIKNYPRHLTLSAISSRDRYESPRC